MCHAGAASSEVVYESPATTRATSTPTPPTAPSSEPSTTAAAGHTEPDAVGQDEPLAKVIPLGIFDPFTEAQKRW
jgi:hypothetical protein